MNLFRRFLIVILFSILTLATMAQEPYYFQSTPKNGEGISTFLQRFHLDGAQCNYDKFYELNNLSAGDRLLLGKSYQLPVKIYTYNGTSIRSTIENQDYSNAVKIKDYNLNILEAGIRKTDYRDSKILWVPEEFLTCWTENPEVIELEENELLEPLFGKEYERVEIVDNSLSSEVFYLMSGHGGPDPGAIGKYGNHNLCEDEYAYDVTLRLARNLMQHGARVHIIIQDPDDGIRDEKILLCDTDELVNGKPIPLNQLKRLQQRTDYVNQLFYKNRQEGYSKQTAVMIHVDSRSEQLKKDVFFMYCENSSSGEMLATNLHNTFQNKYKIHRADGTYNGYIRTRGLYVLRNTAPPAVFIELGNIRNARDQKRILLSSNRQALADWIFEGLTQDNKTYANN